MSRLLALFVVVVLTAGCSAQADPAAPSGGPATEPSPRAAPYRIDRLHALSAVRSLRVPGFKRVLVCPTRRPAPCRREGTERSRWLVGAQLHGASLPGGNGLGELVTTIVTTWPSAARASSYADRLTKQLRRYDGDYDILLRKTGSRRYIPADRGKGELHDVAYSEWRGTVLRRLFHYVFDDLSSSSTVAGGRVVLSRGRYVLDLEWVARNQRTDRRLSQLPRRLLQALR